MVKHAPNSMSKKSALITIISALQLSTVVSELELAATGWAPSLSLHETLRAAARSDEPFLVPTAGGPPPNLTLGTILEPFANKLAAPFVRLMRGAGGEPAARDDLPGTLDEVVEMMTRPNDPWSVILRLEELDPASDSMLPLFQDLLAPVLPLYSKRQRDRNTTAHVYISGPGASALPNHTDVTEIVVLQLLGRKEWLYCRAKPRAPGFAATLFPFEAAKLVKCETYDDVEMNSGALDCERAVTSPGDVLFLPRRTVHSARAVHESYSVHLTVGINIPRKRSSRAPSQATAGPRRRILTQCDDTDEGAADPYGDGCAAYVGNPSWCGPTYDDDDFSADVMCCECGGGSADQDDDNDGETVSDGSFLHPFTLSGSCAGYSYLDDTYTPVAETADGRLYYQGQASGAYVYYDADCDGDGSGVGRWIIDSDEPSTWRTSDLDADATCNYYARIDSTAFTPPSGTLTWTMYCGSSWDATALTLTESEEIELSPDDCTTGCDSTCPAQCDEMGCDGVQTALCNGDCLCDGAGCDGAGCDGSGCDISGCDGWGCDATSCDQSCDNSCDGSCDSG